MSSLKSLAKSPKAKVFRRAYVKRRDVATGLLESTWQEITSDVKKWGTIKMSADFTRPGRFRFSTTKLVVANDTGKYNDETDSKSLWFGKAISQRSLVKIEAGYTHETLASSGIWTRTEYPANPTVFIGLLSGDMVVSSKNEVTMPLKPLTEVFRGFQADRITGYTTLGSEASTWIAKLRDFTNGSALFPIRHFFDNSVANFDISSTSIVYKDLITSTVENIRGKTAWDVIERFAQAEGYIAYINNLGVFKFISKSAQTSTTWSFFGGTAVFNTEYGHNIKKINSYGRKLTSYYSRVEVKFGSEETITSYVTKEAGLTMTGGNTPWNLGDRTLKIDNNWIPNTVTALAVADTVFREVSNFRPEIDFTATYVPDINVLDRVKVTYDTGAVTYDSLWGVNNWTSELTFASITGDAIRLNSRVFKVTSVEQNIEKFETRIKGKE